MNKALNTPEKILVIVESPNKVKTISAILKKAGYTKVTVMASVGHIMKLADGGPAFNSGIYPKKQFKMNLVVSDDKKKVVNDLETHAKNVDKIFICSDHDREGELISLTPFRTLSLSAQGIWVGRSLGMKDSAITV